jgi:hypothetical protein
MPVLIFKLHGAPPDEVEEVRALLHANGIEFYETHAGNWGIGTAAMWLHDDSRLAEARSLLATYQAERALRVRQEYAAAKKSQPARSLRVRLLANPLAAIIGLLFILLVLYLSLAPFLNMRDWL